MPAEIIGINRIPFAMILAYVYEDDKHICIRLKK